MYAANPTFDRAGSQLDATWSRSSSSWSSASPSSSWASYHCYHGDPHEPFQRGAAVHTVYRLSATCLRLSTSYETIPHICSEGVGDLIPREDLLNLCMSHPDIRIGWKQHLAPTTRQSLAVYRAACFEPSFSAWLMYLTVGLCWTCVFGGCRSCLIQIVEERSCWYGRTWGLAPTCVCIYTLYIYIYMYTYIYICVCVYYDYIYIYI